jgi:hypothetical protein
MKSGVFAPSEPGLASLPARCWGYQSFTRNFPSDWWVNRISQMDCDNPNVLARITPWIHQATGASSTCSNDFMGQRWSKHAPDEGHCDSKNWEKYMQLTIVMGFHTMPCMKISREQSKIPRFSQHGLLKHLRKFHLDHLREVSESFGRKKKQFIKTSFQRKPTYPSGWAWDWAWDLPHFTHTKNELENQHF